MVAAEVGASDTYFLIHLKFHILYLYYKKPYQLAFSRCIDSRPFLISDSQIRYPWPDIKCIPSRHFTLH